MRASRKYRIPGDLALLYEFANTLDERRFLRHGVRHIPQDEFATPKRLAEWMAARRLLARGATVTGEEFKQVLRLRAAVRALLQRHARGRPGDRGRRQTFAHLAADFPLVVRWHENGGVGLSPARSGGVGGLAAVLGQLNDAARSGTLGRLKMCASPECRWIFYDRSKPRSKRWCVSSLCGNREKTRRYRRGRTRAGRTR